MKDLSLHERQKLTQHALGHRDVQILQGRILGYTLLVIGLYTAQVKKNTSSMQQKIFDDVVRCIESEYRKGEDPGRSLRKSKLRSFYVNKKIPNTMIDRQIFNNAVDIAKQALTAAHSQLYGSLLPPGH